MNRACLKGLIVAAGLAVTFSLSAASLRAQTYPDKPVRIVVPLPAGGAGDVAARALAQSIGETASATVIVENRAGGAGIPGSEFVAKAPADGYTFLMGFHGPLSVLPHLQKLPFDPAKDFVPVINLINVPNILIAHPSVPAKDLKGLIAYAKSNPGKLSYASQGIGSTGHLGGELLKHAAGIDLVHVPYKGAAPAANDLLAGHVDVGFFVVTLANPHVEAKRLIALGMASEQREEVTPDVPTLVEQGVPVVLQAWFGLVAPAGTPQEAIDWMNKAANKAFASPESRKRFSATGTTMPLGTPEAFGKFIASETKRFGEILKQAEMNSK